MESFIRGSVVCSLAPLLVKGTVVLLLITSPVSGMGLGTWQTPAHVYRN